MSFFCLLLIFQASYSNMNLTSCGVYNTSILPNAVTSPGAYNVTVNVVDSLGFKGNNLLASFFLLLQANCTTVTYFDDVTSPDIVCNTTQVVLNNLCQGKFQRKFFLK